MTTMTTMTIHDDPLSSPAPPCASTLSALWSVRSPDGCGPFAGAGVPPATSTLIVGPGAASMFGATVSVTGPGASPWSLLRTRVVPSPAVTASEVAPVVPAVVSASGRAGAGDGAGVESVGAGVALLAAPDSLVRGSVGMASGTVGLMVGLFVGLVVLTGSSARQNLPWSTDAFRNAGCAQQNFFLLAVHLEATSPVVVNVLLVLHWNAGVVAGSVVAFVGAVVVDVDALAFLHASWLTK